MEFKAFYEIMKNCDWLANHNERWRIGHAKLGKIMKYLRNEEIVSTCHCELGSHFSKHGGKDPFKH